MEVWRCLPEGCHLARCGGVEVWGCGVDWEHARGVLHTFVPPPAALTLVLAACQGGQLLPLVPLVPLPLLYLLLSLRFLLHVEEGYSSNPYHSSTHAADVLRTLHVVLTQVRACA